jgi:hypothetical protein
MRHIFRVLVLAITVALACPGAATAEKPGTGEVKAAAYALAVAQLALYNAQVELQRAQQELQQELHAVSDIQAMIDHAIAQYQRDQGNLNIMPGQRVKGGLSGKASIISPKLNTSGKDAPDFTTDPESYNLNTTGPPHLTIPSPDDPKTPQMVSLYAALDAARASAPARIAQAQAAVSAAKAAVDNAQAAVDNAQAALNDVQGDQ